MSNEPASALIRPPVGAAAGVGCAETPRPGVGAPRMGTSSSEFAGPAGARPAAARAPAPGLLPDAESGAVGRLIARRESFRAALEIAQEILAGQEPDAMWGPIARRARRLVRADAAIVRTAGP